MRCRAALDVGVEAVFTGAAPGYKLEKTAGAAEDVKRRGGGEETKGVKRRGGRRRDGEEGRCGVDCVLEEERREFSGRPHGR